MRPMTRRTFLQASGLTVLGVAAGCARGPKTSPSTGTLEEIAGGRSQAVQAISVGTELLSGIEERVAWGLIDPVAKQPFASGDARFWFARQPGEQASGPYAMRAIGGPLAGRGVFVADDVVVPSDGIWFGLVELTAGEDEPIIGLERFKVGATTQMPKPGDDAVSVPTPTTKAPRGVDPICTLDPPCGMHEVSLDVALERGDPIVLTFGTPAFCQTQFCGPITQLIDAERPRHPDVTFIHVELLRDDSNDTILAYGGRRPAGYEGNFLAPAVQAWQITEEPATYYIATDGTIAVRQLSALDTVDLGAGIAAIA